jgi:hypothetical protein
MATLSVSSANRAAQALSQAQQRVQADRRQVREDEQQLRESEEALAKSEESLAGQRRESGRLPGDGGAALLTLQRGNNASLSAVSGAPSLGQRLNVQA